MEKINNMKNTARPILNLKTIQINKNTKLKKGEFRLVDILPNTRCRASLIFFISNKNIDFGRIVKTIKNKPRMITYNDLVLFINQFELFIKNSKQYRFLSLSDSVDESPMVQAYITIKGIVDKYSGINQPTEIVYFNRK